jgi:hypothetical protein
MLPTSIHLQIEFQANLRSADYAVNVYVQGFIAKDVNSKLSFVAALFSIWITENSPPNFDDYCNPFVL